MQLQKTRDTAPEMALRRELHRRGLRFRLHKKLLPDRRRSVDIVFPGPRVAVDVRGCFWHGCPDHYRRGSVNAEWWEDKLQTNIARDALTEEQLRAAGYVVVVVWEHEQVVSAADRVERAVRERRNIGP
ncbi:very short patch repair endonuclease [Modestobacter versicolor]|uniref:Very short patch repair endonuclease n=2 Tax=Modestobacter versicolor TaxID=429133 RepID=A0A323VJP9_9ACTN|nr:very short patch repair endonuclease [Modestobacter versicolor]